MLDGYTGRHVADVTWAHITVPGGELICFRHHHVLGGGPAEFETLTTNVDNWGGVTSFPCKTVTTIVDNCGGVTSYACNNSYYHCW